MRVPNGSPSDMNRFALDTGTAERLVAGSLDASDAPPEYRAVAQKLQALRQPADSAELAGGAETVDQIAAAIVVARRTPLEPRPKRSPVRAGKLAGAAAAIVITLTSGFAVAGALPESAQNAASVVLGRVGIPIPTRDEQPTRQEQPTGDEQPTGQEQRTVGVSPTTAGPPPTTGAVQPEPQPATNADDDSNKSSSSTTTSKNSRKSFQVSTPDGQASLSLDGQLPPGWPSGFPVAPNTKKAGSGSLGDTSKTVLVGVYSATSKPEDVFDFYKSSNAYTVDSSTSAGAGSAFVGTVEFSGAYTGNANVVSNEGTTYVIVSLETGGAGATSST